MPSAPRGALRGRSGHGIGQDSWDVSRELAPLVGAMQAPGPAQGPGRGFWFGRSGPWGRPRGRWGPTPGRVIVKAGPPSVATTPKKARAALSLRAQFRGPRARARRPCRACLRRGPCSRAAPAGSWLLDSSSLPALRGSGPSRHWLLTPLGSPSDGRSSPGASGRPRRHGPFRRHRCP